VFTGRRGLILSAVLIIFSLIQLYSTWTIIPSTHMRPLHVGIVTMLAYILYPAAKGARKDRLPIWDLILGVLSLAVFLYPVVFFNEIVRQNAFTTLQYIIAGAAILLLMEACRRVVGLPIVIIATVFIAVGLVGRAMPGFLANRGYSVTQVVKHLFFTQEGIFGAPIGASSTFIFLFILFGAFLQMTGVGPEGAMARPEPSLQRASWVKTSTASTKARYSVILPFEMSNRLAISRGATGAPDFDTALGRSGSPYHRQMPRAVSSVAMIRSTSIRRSGVLSQKPLAWATSASDPRRCGWV
jgi:hypothetical protein